RDVERYGVNWQHTYQLVIKFGAHEYLEQRYPAVYRHLCQFETKLKNRGQCKYGRARKSQDASKPYPGQHHWLELDNNPSDEYIGMFTGTKILYQEIAQKLPFFFDKSEGYLVNDTCYIMTSNSVPLEALTAILNSSIFRACFKDNFPENAGNTYRAKKSFFEKIPIKKPTPQQANLFAALVPLIQFAKADEQSAAYQFLEDLIDACVMECYFRDHMAERDLLFLDQLAPTLDKVAQTFLSEEFSQDDRQECLSYFLNLHNAPTAKIRNQLDHLTTKSPDLLAIIKNEGKVE
ncbi:MAG: TaqI-like C-terminal specificity domain-containing protein, partial [Verrucomicrobiales bacterium]